jgi:hypothetical protein
LWLQQQQQQLTSRHGSDNEEDWSGNFMLIKTQ